MPYVPLRIVGRQKIGCHFSEPQSVVSPNQIIKGLALAGYLCAEILASAARTGPKLVQSWQRMTSHWRTLSEHGGCQINCAIGRERLNDRRKNSSGLRDWWVLNSYTLFYRVTQGANQKHKQMLLQIVLCNHLSPPKNALGLQVLMGFEQHFPLFFFSLLKFTQTDGMK